MNCLSVARVWLVWLCLIAPGVHAMTCSNGKTVPSNPDSAYTVNADATVTHQPTGLVWKRCSEGQSWDGNTCSGTATRHTWAQALTLARNSNFAGQTDWRLPNLKELRSLVEECRRIPAINDSVFPATLDSYFWSGSPLANSSYYSWVVSFYSGDTNTYYRNDFTSWSVRLVRGGQSFDSLGGSAIAPSAPTQITASAGNAQASVSFSAPSATGGSAITGYTVTSNPGSITATGTASPITVLSLTNNVSYTFTVTATNAIGTSAASVASNAVTPTAPYEPNPLLQVSITGLGSGTVTARRTDDGVAINLRCTNTAGQTSGVCSANLSNGTRVTLSATAVMGSRLATWGGVCGVAGPECVVAMDASKAVTADFVTIGACESSAVASITPNGYAFAHNYQAFEVNCQSGRYGVVRLPHYGYPDKVEVCAFQQGSCTTKTASTCITTPSVDVLKQLYNERGGGVASLLAHPVVGPLSSWVCQ